MQYLNLETSIASIIYLFKSIMTKEKVTNQWYLKSAFCKYLWMKKTKVHKMKVICSWNFYKEMPLAVYKIILIEGLSN